ncbi:MAG TPA: CaiB/BaiF CoA-transferase family protein [Rhizomicrobium sp.]|jgi:crotonobetainyl-CoA:carnitine CoA-transferase CaiB-like acyl-CoA transferase|nr:CaiB/BaiF CoA-transferase family protein [Rhizomicrobium sp.]
MRALEDLIVLDLTHMLAGPYGTMLLADMGARTIKIEPPGKGEGTRRLLEQSHNFSREGMGAYFLTLCRNKESVALDLKSEEGLKLFYELAKHADIVMSNFGAGVTTRLKIDFDHLSKINPRIITCAISGFGETGPDPNRPAFDLVAQGMGGGMSLTGYADGEPLRAGIPIGDLAGGLFGALGVLSAVEARHRTGRGQHVDISMFDCQLSLLNYMATMYLMSGTSPGRSGNGHFVHVPYNTFRTKTRYLIIAVITDNFWVNLVELLKDDALRREEFKTQPGRLANKAFIEERVQAAFEKETCEYWLEALAKYRIPAAPVNELEHAFSDPQALARNMKVDVPLVGGGTVSEPGNPIKMSETYQDTYTAPPLVGQDTVAVLREFAKLDDAALDDLKARHIIGVATSD